MFTVSSSISFTKLASHKASHKALVSKYIPPSLHELYRHITDWCIVLYIQKTCFFMNNMCS